MICVDAQKSLFKCFFTEVSPGLMFSSVSVLKCFAVVNVIILVD